MKKRRIIVNNDYYNIFQVMPPVTDVDIHRAVDTLAGTQVDTLCMMVPHTLGEGSILDPDLVRLYEHPASDPCMANLDRLAAEGKDPFAMLLARAREHGLEFLASLRMNDTHFLDQPFNPWVSPFYYDNLHNRIDPQAVATRIGTEMDYRKSVVRAHMLAAMEQCLGRYDVDGIEMDMTRNGTFFPPGDHPEECAPVMTQFVRDVRALLDRHGERRGRRLVLAATLPCSPLAARHLGLDVRAWTQLGLIDLLCLSTQFLADFDRDVADAKLKAGDVPVYAGCDRNFEFPGRIVPLETYRAMAMNYLRQGADGIYLYNVMDWWMDFDRMPEMVKTAGGQGGTAHDACLMNEVGDIESVAFLDKLYLVSHGTEAADKPYGSLPVRVPAGGQATVRLTVGDDVTAAAAAGRLDRILLQTVSGDCTDRDNYTVRLNGIDLSRQYAFVPHATPPVSALLFAEPKRRAVPPVECVRRHPVRPIDLPVGVNLVTVQSYRDPLTATDVELAIFYK